MKTIISLLISIVLLSACTSKNNTTERISIKFSTVYDSIESRMPGQLLINSQYAIWTDPFSAENQVHVIDLKTNKEIGKLVNIGNGPEEFLTPGFSLSTTNDLIVYDMNNNKMGLYSLDNISNNKNPLISLTTKQTKNITKIIETDNHSFVSFHPNAQFPFKVEDGDYFGKYPFTENVKNKYNISQGNIAYNPQNEYFIYASMDFPYIAAYHKNNSNFKLMWEKKGEMDYTIIENELIPNKKRKGAAELALTKDYIVTLQRDYQNDPTDETTVGRDFNKIPQTLFLYDYKSNLKKIVHLHTPILRIAADTKSNTVYAIVINPDFTLVKCELPE